MKKFLSVIICLALAVGMLSVGAQAAAPTLTAVCPETSMAGGTVTVDVVAGGIENCSGVAFHMSYDPEMMEVSEIVKAEELSAWSLVDNYEYAPGELAVALAGTTGTALSGKIASVTFELKSSARGTASFSLGSLEAFTPSSNSISLTGVGAETDISPMEQAMLSVTPSAGENGEVVLNVELSEASYYCGLSFVLSYDNSRYTVSGAAAESGLAASYVALNPEYGPEKKQVFMSAVFTSPSSYNGPVATVTLVPVAGASGEVGDVSVEITDFIDSSYEQLDIGWVWSPAALSGLSDNGTAVSATASFLNTKAAGQNVTAFMALYSADGRFLGIDSESCSIPSGSCGEFPLSLKSDSRADYVRVFFMDDSYHIVGADIRQSLTEG